MKYITKKNNINIFFYILLIIIFIIFILIILFLIINYYYGKIFHPCLISNSNEIFYIDVSLPSQNSITHFEKCMRDKGTILNPKINFSNAKGKKMSYSELPTDIQKYYYSKKIQEDVSRAVGENVYYSDESEKYRIFARLYEDEDDFLDWHYDNNFTMGNRYTLVIPIIIDKNNTSEFMIKDRLTGDEKVIPIPIGKGVVYNGSITYHSISRQTKGSRRMVIIIPFYTNYKKNFIGNIREYIRNITDKNLTL